MQVTMDTPCCNYTTEVRPWQFACANRYRNMSSKSLEFQKFRVPKVLSSKSFEFFQDFPFSHFSVSIFPNVPNFSFFPFPIFYFFPVFLWVSWSPANAMSCYVMICSHILLERYSVVVNRWGGEGNKQQMHGGLGTLQLKMLLAVRQQHIADLTPVAPFNSR